MSTDIEPVLYPGRGDAIAGLVEKYKMALNNKKRRTLMNMNVNSFRGFEFGLIVSRCCRVSVFTFLIALLLFFYLLFFIFVLIGFGFGWSIQGIHKCERSWSSF